MNKQSGPAAHIAPVAADVDTLDFKPTTGMQGVATTPCLTVLCHPDEDCIGAQAILPLGRGPVLLSRLEPLFHVPVGRDTQPLGDPHVSRRPISIEHQGDKLVFRAAEGAVSCHVAGMPLVATAQVPYGALDRGVTLRLGRHVAVLLHNRPVVELARRRETLVGQSSAVAELRENVRKVAAHPVHVLVQGESGVGKELVARAVHEASPQGRGPFIAVNTGAIQPSLANSELFGHVRGSFTGAVGDHDGFFARADGGTLFLDEIGELGADVQALLLRALESGEIQRIGDRKPRHVRVRVVAATDRPDLEERLRIPVIQRLSGYRIVVPPLRERFEDLGLLLYHALHQEFARIHQVFPPALHRRAHEPAVPPEVFERLVRHPFSGNVRELFNVARRLTIDGLDRSTSEILQSVEAALATTAQEVHASEPSAPAKGYVAPSEISDELLLAALHRNHWQMAPTARDLGIARSSLYLLVDQCPHVRKVHEIGTDEIGAAIAAAAGDLDRAAARLQVSPRALKAHVNKGLSR
ncbi:MAG: sigma-54-dependent Fis family transcriptional regulator [Deltaproteobacteria bacterium]|nr:sigma-54-dependent Fis family transcriptional regulator [Deltaproteobacteria bacterium]